MSIDVVTFGCRLNAYESEVIRREAAAAGLDDTVVMNTCAVTGGGRTSGEAGDPPGPAREARRAHCCYRLCRANRSKDIC